MITHYVPAYTIRSGRREKAVCGTFVNAEEFSIEPTCRDCQRWLDADNDAFASVEALLHEPCENPSKVERMFDPLDGYTPRGGVRE